MNNSDKPAPPDIQLEPNEVLGWLEFACWTMLALTPMLYWVNGPAVSTDQMVTRWVLVAISAFGAVALCARSRRRRTEKQRGEEQSR